MSDTNIQIYKTSPRSEQAYVLRVMRRLGSMGISARREIPLLGRSIDLLFCHNDSLQSVEFKLYDWRRALVQAQHHTFGVDYSWVCLPQRQVTSEMELAFRAECVGLRFYKENQSWPFVDVVPAKRIDPLFPGIRESLLKFLT